jgi:hypothetical protein
LRIAALVGLVVADDASCGSTEGTVMTGQMTGSATY